MRAGLEVALASLSLPDRSWHSSRQPGILNPVKTTRKRGSDAPEPGKRADHAEKSESQEPRDLVRYAGGLGRRRPRRTKDTTSTFLDNLSLPVHRWFRYSAGFSAAWVREVIQREKQKGRRRVFDPFVGSGTVALESELCQVESIGVEAHPFVSRIAQAKLHWRESPKDFTTFALSILEEAKKEPVEREEYPGFDGKVLPASDAAPAGERFAASAKEGPTGRLFLNSPGWSCAPSCANAPLSERRMAVRPSEEIEGQAMDPFKAFEAAVYLFSSDMAQRQKQEPGPKPQLLVEDARACKSLPAGWADLVITSPPYANNYDYADATRLEMTFFGEVEGWGGLQERVRRHLIRSCTQHVAPLTKQTDDILQAAVLAPIAGELRETCQRLAREREGHGGKKPYHTMIAAYFKDMAEVWLALRRVTAGGALVCFVIGDSAPYGIMCPWIGGWASWPSPPGLRPSRLKRRETET